LKTLLSAKTLADQAHLSLKARVLKFNMENKDEHLTLHFLKEQYKENKIQKKAIHTKKCNPRLWPRHLIKDAVLQLKRLIDEVHQDGKDLIFIDEIKFCYGDRQKMAWFRN